MWVSADKADEVQIAPTMGLRYVSDGGSVEDFRQPFGQSLCDAHPAVVRVSDIKEDLANSPTEVESCSCSACRVDRSNRRQTRQTHQKANVSRYDDCRLVVFICRWPVAASQSTV
jgi:hypothetical protein